MSKIFLVYIEDASLEEMDAIAEEQNLKDRTAEGIIHAMLGFHDVYATVKEVSKEFKNHF